MKMMYGMLTALAPVTIYALYAYRLRALLMILTGVLSAMAAEAVYQKLAGSKKITATDGSAAITGLLLALATSVSTPLYAIGVSAAFGIIVGKQMLGGLGKNLFNPMLFGRLFYLFVFPDSILPWRQPAELSTPLSVMPADLVTRATPLELLREHGHTTVAMEEMQVLGHSGVPLFDMFMGRLPGTIGEISALMILFGAFYLLYRGWLRWRIPLAAFVVVLIAALLLGHNPLFHFFAGSLMIGTFFMATDPMTSPKYPKGQILFGVGIGVIIMAMRLWGWQTPGQYEFTEGTTFAILLMNLMVPLFDTWFKPVRKAA